MENFRKTPILFLLVACFSSILVNAQDVAVASEAARQNVYQSALFYALAGVAFILFIFIFQLSRTLSAIAENYAKNKKRDLGKLPLWILITGSAFLSPLHSIAKESTGTFYHHGFGSNAINALILIIIIELLVILYYTRMIQLFMRKEKIEQPYVAPLHSAPSFWDRFNKSVAIQKEEAIMFDHSYDGIRELDNALPPWWRYGFYLTILFAVVYMLHYHVIKTGPLMLDEYRMENQEAEQAIAEHRKNAANFIDESSVVQLTDAASLESGKVIFIEKCAVCHGKSGEGLVGPNLTDRYWIHGGSLREVFSTIKYGVTAKGMQSWKEQMSSLQMAQAASYIMTLQGTNPANPKKEEGTLYEPPSENTAPDSTAVPTDSIAAPTTPIVPAAASTSGTPNP